MLKNKKLIALLLGGIIGTSSILTGCGSGGSASSSGGEGEKPVNLVWYVIGKPQNDGELVEEEVNKYIKDKINATVDIKHIDFGDYSQKMNVIANSGEEYDLAFTCSWAFPYLDNARKGAFLELNDLIDSHGKDLKNVIDERLWKGAEVDGNIYAVPNQKEIAGAPMWVFDKELVEKYDIPYQDIHSVDDLEPWLALIKEKEPDFVPFYTQGDGIPIEGIEDITSGLGIFYDDESLTVKNMYETEELKHLFTKLREFYEKGYINQDAAVSNMKNEVKRFVWKADGQPYAENGWSQSLGREVVTSSIVSSYVTNASTTGAMTAISATSKHPEKAMELINLVNKDSTLRNLLMFGIEGTHYEKVSDNQIKRDPNGPYSVTSWAYGNLFDTYVLDSDPVDKWDAFEEFNQKAKTSTILGFKFDTEKVVTQMSAVSNAFEEFIKPLYTGSVDTEETLEKLNKKLYDSGLEDIKVELQRQLDEWKKENK
ncbi:ABC transporter substrate-binding protein [Clostridium perfringens]|uniref:ABC transporter substrate-binding protein n=1 Tax=Clostridium perfringens TaxID=1502 RepID=UPI001A2BDE79|nr:ABC transporter substrate-binding protein [Clostridium perfringens]MCH1962855.1 ABC transporter substrate-binding protein [Clostridium perfringens]MDK0617164.1 ABC transporter substrate-binding protein [Clostridium perfringens]HAT4363983.1 ABC transporter substrate-binding protein [Clostridium perfringens]